jgi:hypothetical protein
MVLLGCVVKWKLVSIHLEIVLISTQDRCMVCPKWTIGSEISLDAVTPLGVKHAIASKALGISITYMVIIACNISPLKI